MQTIDRIDPLRRAVAALRDAGPVALVPTMGALHQGHLTLVRAARELPAKVVVSIFVNPRQFGVNEDLDAYPRPFERDCALLEAEGAALVWATGRRADVPAGLRHQHRRFGRQRGLVRRGAGRPLRRGRDGRVQAVSPGAARLCAVRRKGLATNRGDPPHGTRPRADAAASPTTSSACPPCAKPTASR